MVTAALPRELRSCLVRWCQRQFIEAQGKVQNDANWSEAWAILTGSIAYVWHDALHATIVAQSLKHEGFKIRAQTIWAKERLLISPGDYHQESRWQAICELYTGTAFFGAQNM